MHHRFFLFLLILLIKPGPNGFSQICFPAKKVYAYFEPVMKGVINKEDAKKKPSGGNYHIFIESRKPAISVNNIWINGVIHNVRLQEVTTPVLYGPDTGNGLLNSGKKPFKMVPATKLKVYKLIFIALDQAHPQAAPPKKYASRQLVMELQYQKKIKYITLNEIKQVTAAAML